MTREQMRHRVLRRMKAGTKDEMSVLALVQSLGLADGHSYRMGRFLNHGEKPTPAIVEALGYREVGETYEVA